MRVRCDCYTAWSNYSCLPGYVPAADASVVGFWMKTKSREAFALLTGGEASPDFDTARDHAIVVGREKESGNILAFAEEQDCYPYSGQWNGYSPFSFLDKEVEFDASELDKFLASAETALEQNDLKSLVQIYSQKEPVKAQGEANNQNRTCSML